MFSACLVQQRRKLILVKSESNGNCFMFGYNHAKLIIINYVGWIEIDWICLITKKICFNICVLKLNYVVWIEIDCICLITKKIGFNICELKLSLISI